MTEILFTGDWQEIVTGNLQKGGNFSINYDSNRLPRGRQTYNGYPTWSILVYVKFSESGAVKYQSLAQGEGTMMNAQFDIPEDGEEVIIWFYNIDRSCVVHDYDSNYGSNYHFTLTA